jgi:hypothetical protein
MRQSLTPYVPSSATRPVDLAGQQRVADERSADTLSSSTRALSPELTRLLRGLKAGQRIKITQTVRVGQKTWQAVVTGFFRDFNYLSTGLATDRVPEDQVLVVLVHFTKDNGELSSVTIDEHSQIEIVN